MIFNQIEFHRNLKICLGLQNEQYNYYNISKAKNREVLKKWIGLGIILLSTFLKKLTRIR